MKDYLFLGGSAHGKTIAVPDNEHMFRVAHLPKLDIRDFLFDTEPSTEMVNIEYEYYTRRDLGAMINGTPLYKRLFLSEGHTEEVGMKLLQEYLLNRWMLEE